jgi:hypothetical protein
MAHGDMEDCGHKNQILLILLIIFERVARSVILHDTTSNALKASNMRTAQHDME